MSSWYRHNGCRYTLIRLPLLRSSLIWVYTVLRHHTIMILNFRTGWSEQQCRPRSDCSYRRSSLIRVYTCFPFRPHDPWFFIIVHSNPLVSIILPDLIVLGKVKVRVSCAVVIPVLAKICIHSIWVFVHPPSFLGPFLFFCAFSLKYRCTCISVKLHMLQKR